MKAAGKADAAAMAKLVVVAVDRRNAIKMEFFLLLIFLYTFVNETSKNKRTVEQNNLLFGENLKISRNFYNFAAGDWDRCFGILL